MLHLSDLTRKKKVPAKTILLQKQLFFIANPKENFIFLSKLTITDQLMEGKK